MILESQLWFRLRFKNYVKETKNYIQSEQTPNFSMPQNPGCNSRGSRKRFPF